jgi:hypothetical protein
VDKYPRLDIEAILEDNPTALSVCIAKGYDRFGNIKRDVGTWYDDVGVWTREMEEAKRKSDGG